MRYDEMWETGKIHMIVNTMPGMIVYKPIDERGEMSGDVSELQARDSCLYCKKLVIRREIAGPMKTGRRRIQTRRLGILTENQFHSIILIKCL